MTSKCQLCRKPLSHYERFTNTSYCRACTYGSYFDNHKHQLWRVCNLCEDLA